MYASETLPGLWALRTADRLYRLIVGRLAVVVAIVAIGVLPGFAGAEFHALTADVETNLLSEGRLYRAQADEGFPGTPAEIPEWLALREPVERVSILGGSYWLYAEARHGEAIGEWVLDASGSLIEEVEARLYAPDGTVQRIETGYRHDAQYMLHYGKRVELQPGATYGVLVRFSSPYFASIPEFELIPEARYRKKVAFENVLTIAALGALVSLALFYFFIHLSTGDKSQLYYSIYLVAYFFGWALVFHIPVELFGYRNLSIHYIPFFLLPVLNTLFYLEFLQLKVHFPRLARASRINFILPALFLPTCFVAASYAHALATLAITIWLVLALASGIACWRRGYRPARYFTFAFLALIVPATLILPGNVDLMPELVDNSELLTLLGGTLDALLLAFALADRIKLLNEQKDEYMGRLNEALELAQTDVLTGLGNRYAFDLHLNECFDFAAKEEDKEQQVLFLIDLDGLKLINDRYGHSSGDELLRRFARGVREHCVGDVAIFRVGGDEFALVSRRYLEDHLRNALARVERQLVEGGFGEAGVSYGVAYAYECATPADLINFSDGRMYEHKSARKRLRAALA